MKVTCDLTVTLDGYSAGHNQTEQRPFGDDGGDHVPVFVLTHYPRDPQPMDGGTTFHFVTTASSPRFLARGKRPGTATSRSWAARPPSTSTWRRA